MFCYSSCIEEDMVTLNVDRPVTDAPAPVQTYLYQYRYRVNTRTPRQPDRKLVRPNRSLSEGAPPPSTPPPIHPRTLPVTVFITTSEYTNAPPA
ncbi:hypothetical protein J6590_038846 [Homalodisca vitripennis]|nr:hypothetical protein J6590_038846 [Homalodisca vitripennis]